MSTKRWTVGASYVKVGTGPLLVELGNKLEECRVHAGTTAPVDDTEDYHQLSADSISFSIQKVLDVYVRADGDATDVVVT